MKSMALLLAAGALALCGTGAFADTTWLPTIRWFNACGGNHFWERPNPVCRARLHGAVEGLVAGIKFSHGKRWACIPDVVSPREELLVFRKYLDNHPEALCQNFGTVVAAAFAQSYPCPKG